MVRLGLIILMLLCVTITGVYAAWTYAGTEDIADVYAESKITITDAQLTGANGTYTIESNLVLTIDQANEDHLAQLVFASNNSDDIYLKVTFTPAANAPQNIKDNAVPTQIFFGTTTDMKYKIDTDGNYSATGTETDILSFLNHEGNKLDIVWTDNGDGTFSYTMNEDTLKSQISLSQDFILDIKSEYDAFRAALNGNVVAHVTDGKTTSN